MTEPGVEDLPTTKFLRMREGRPFCKHCGYREERHVGGWCVPDDDSDDDDDWN